MPDAGQIIDNNLGGGNRHIPLTPGKTSTRSQTCCLCLERSNVRMNEFPKLLDIMCCLRHRMLLYSTWNRSVGFLLQLQQPRPTIEPAASETTVDTNELIMSCCAMSNRSFVRSFVRRLVRPPLNFCFVIHESEAPSAVYSWKLKPLDKVPLWIHY